VRDGLNFRNEGEITPPGFTVDYKIANDLLYVLDSDSGLTIYDYQETGLYTFRYPIFSGYENVYVDSSKVYLSSIDSGLTVFSMVLGLPGERVFYDNSKNLETIYLHNDILLASYPTGLSYYKTDNRDLKYIDQINSVNNIRSITNNDSAFYAIKRSGEIVALNYDDNDSLKVGFTHNLGFVPTSVTFFNERLYCAYVNRSRLRSIFDPYVPSNFNRFALWRAGIEIFKDHPIFGVGDIDLAEYYIQYKRPFDKEIQGHMHNNFIHFLVTLGLFGLIVLLFLFFKMIIIDWKIYNQVKDKPFLSSVALGTIASFCGFLASGLTELNFWDHEIQTLVWFTFGLNYALFLLSKKENIN
jgi:hypothetical protein